MAEYSKYYKQQKQVSYDSGNTWESLNEYQKGELIENDSSDCGYVGILTRWINSGYTCDGYNKYNVEVKQVSEDGVTWVSTGYSRRGPLIEANSTDCGYSPHPSSGYAGQYLTFVAIDDCVFIADNSDFYYSVNNGATWDSVWDRGNPKEINVSSGNKVLWKGWYRTDEIPVGNFGRSEGRYNVEGNIMSLLYGDDFANKTSIANYSADETIGVFFGLFADSDVISAGNLILPNTLSDWCFDHMFKGCTSLTTAPELPASVLTYGCYCYMFMGCTSLATMPDLPATVLAIDCYYGMFRGCTSLTTTTSVLPATTLANNCYIEMFSGCTSITTAPALPATELAHTCYKDMFSGCWSLTTAPVLPALTLVGGCYAGMFEDCVSLNYIKAMFTTPITYAHPEYTYWWLKSVASTGTFVKNSAATWDVRGSSGIPDNWTIQTASS